MASVPNATWGPLETGIKKGFYRDQGIELELSSGQGSAVVFQLLASEEADFTTVGADAVLIARSKGVPIKSIAVIQQKSATTIYSLESNKILKPKDLEGKRVASALTHISHLNFLSFCKKNGVDMNKIKILPVPAMNLSLLLTDQADATLHFDYIATRALKRSGKAYRAMKIRDFGINSYSNTLVTSDALIAKNPDLVRRMMRASLLTWKYAIEHPEEVEKINLELHPEIDPADAADFSGLANLMVSDETRKFGIGYHNKAGWERLKTSLMELGLLKDQVRVEDAFSTEFLHP